MVTAEVAWNDPLETEFEELGSAMQPLTLAAGTRVFEQGETGNRLLLIVSGQAQTSHRLPNGTEEMLSRSGPGDVVGEIALLTGSRRSATVIALTPLRGWTLDRHGFDALRGDPREVAIKVVQWLVVLTAARLRAICTEIAEPIAHRGGSSEFSSVAQQVQMPGIDYLASLLCFARFRATEDVEAIVRNVPTYAADRGEIVVHEGEQTPSLLLVVRGAVEVMVPQGATKRRVRLAGPGRFVGHNGILDDELSPVVARCRERSVLLAFPRASARALLSDSGRPSRAFSAALLEDTARAISQASRPVLSTTARNWSR
jgi:CRP-like cAMP-binding protein